MSEAPLPDDALDALAALLIAAGEHQCETCGRYVAELHPVELPELRHVCTICRDDDRTAGDCGE